jgi:hypothetical protein
MLDRQRRKRVRPSTLGADKGYHIKDFVAHLRRRKIAPHMAMIEGRKLRVWMGAPLATPATP